MLLAISLILLNGLFGQHYAVSQETPKGDTLLYYWHDPTPDEYPDLVPEDCYLELYLENGIVKKGFFWGTTDEFDMGREGYKCGYFVLPMTGIRHEGDSIMFKLSRIRTERGEIVDNFVKAPIDRHIRSWQEALSHYPKWDCIRGSMYYNDVQFSISSGQKATNKTFNLFPMGDSISVCNLTNYSWTRTFVLVNAQPDTVAEQIRNFYVRYMETHETGSLKEVDNIGRSFLTPEMQEKKGRLIAATGADPLIRAQDISDYGRNSLQCKHLEGDWYEVSYRWAESDTTGIHIPVRIKKDAKGNVRIAYITPDWAEDKYGDHIFDIPNPKVNDKKDKRTFVETFFRAYVHPYVKMSSTLEWELEQLRQTYCTPAMLEKYATMLRKSWEEEGPIDPMIGCADFDAFWYRSLKVTSEGKDRYAVTYNIGVQGWDKRITVTVTRINGRLRICDIEI